MENSLLQEPFLQLWMTHHLINLQSRVKTNQVLKLQILNGSLFERQLISVTCSGAASYFSKGFRLSLFEVDKVNDIDPKEITELYSAEGQTYNAGTVIRLNSTRIEGIICFAPVWNSYRWEKVSIGFVVRAMPPPTLVDEESIETKTIPEHESVTMRCELVEPNVPTVRFDWLRNNKTLKKISTGFTENKVYDIHETDAFTTLSIFDLSVDSNFTCQATNQNTERRHKQFVVKLITTKPQSEAESVAAEISAPFPYAYIAGIAIVIVVTTTLISYVSFRHSYRHKLNLTDGEIEEFRNGKARSAIDKLLNPMQELHYGPYNREVEIPSSQFQIDTSSVLGCGQFGIVYKGLHNHKPIAVKTINPNVHSEKLNLLALLSELKVMIYVNGHKNIIDLIGANTEGLKNGLAYIFVELCPLGSLQNFLLSHQNNFVNQIVQGDTIEVNPVTYSNIVLSADTIFTADLALWVYQIASGMAYLENKKVIHGDLATRNVLLVNQENVKITDFGLARQLFNNQIYQKTNRWDPLPWKWMAIESLRSFTFSSKSDVWSFGITLWEVFTLGDVPYPGLDWTPDFVEKLENNLRMTQPKYAPDGIFSVMVRCWNPEPAERPHFEFLVNYFAEYLRKFPHVEKYIADGDCGCGDDYQSDSYV